MCGVYKFPECRGILVHVPNRMDKSHVVCREELARQNYQKLQLECKTDQAHKDLARLAIIRKKREEEAAGRAGGPAGAAPK